MNTLSYSQNQFEFAICFANSPWIQYSLSASRIHIETTLFRQITLNRLSASWFYYVYTICFANCPWIHYLFRDFALNSLFFFAISLWIQYVIPEITLLTLFFTKSLWICFFRDFTIGVMELLSKRYLFRAQFHKKSILVFAMTFLSASWFYYEFTICFVNFVRIHYRFRGIN